jgi:hypothetical protein
MINICQLKELGLYCMGCCGNNYKGKKEVEDGIKRNTYSYEDATDKAAWGKRQQGFVRACGVCFNVIHENGEIFCPLHPARNNGKDLRDDVCDKNHMCKAFYMFYNQWDDKTRKKFIDFIKSKNLDWYSYSIGMDNNSLFEEFLKSI